MKTNKLLAALLLGAAALTASAQGGYQDGVDYYNAGRFEDSKTILTNNLDKAGTDKAVSYYYLGLLDLKTKNYAGASANFQQGVTANANNPFNYVGLGEAALLQGDKSEASKQFKLAEGLAKKDASVYAAIARAYWDADPVTHAKEIEKYIQKGFKASKNTEPAIYMLQGDMAASTNPGEAAGLYETAINMAQDRGDRVNPEAFVKYANTYFRINPKFAIGKLEELNTLLPTSALAQRELAEKYYENNQLTLAAEQYGKYMRNPNHFQKDEQRYAGLLFFGKKYDESVKVADKVLAKDPTNFYMWRIKMYDYAELKQYDDALAAGEKLFSIPGAELNYKDYDYYGDVLAALKRPAEAVAAYEKGLALNPDKTELLEKISQQYTEAEDYRAAALAMQRYVDSGNNTTNDLYMLSRRYFNYALTLPEGSSERAEQASLGLAAVNAALEKAPEQGTLWRTKAQLLQVKTGKVDAEVVQAYEKMIDAYQAEPDGKTKRADALASACAVIGSYYVGEGDKATARQYYEKYLELKPGDEAVRNYLKTL